MTTPLDPGTDAPAIELKDQAGNTHKLSDYKGQWVVLYFYPKDSTPGCTKQACGFRDAAADLERAGAAVLGVSPDPEASHKKFFKKQSLNFPLLADPNARPARPTASGSRSRCTARHTSAWSAPPTSSMPTARSPGAGTR